MRPWIVALLWVVLAGDAFAQDATPADAGPAEPPITAQDVGGAPVPTEAHGHAVRRDESASAGRIAGRLVLFIPRWAAEVVFSPVRGLLWAYQRFQLGERARHIFFNDDGTLGVFPVAFFETGFGLNIGGRFIYRELLGDGKLSARASYGGRLRQLYSVKANTGTLLGNNFILEVGAQFQIFPKSRFFGFGNQDRLDAPPDTLIDPQNDETSVATRFRHDDLGIEGTFGGRLAGDWWLNLTGAYTRREFKDDAELGDGQGNIIDVYDTDQLVGWDSGLSNLYTELELTYDSRRVTHDYVTRATPSTGWKLSAFAGFVVESDGPADYWRYGVDVQRYFDIYGGDRFLVLRAYLEGVSGSIDEVPFLDLPRLGGPVFLRGYERDRFRDRISALGSAEYSYPAMGNLSGFLFTDVGRVFRSYDDVTTSDLRVGFGGGVQGHTRNSFLTRLFVASSSDGGFFINLSFDPVFDTRAGKESL